MIRVPANFDGPGHSPPLQHLGGDTPVLAVTGGRDHFTPAADIDDLRATGATVLHYPDGEHGFVHDPSRPTHRADDAADAWRQVVAFLR
jgi:carboxymethylenebutenolidase